MRNRKNRIAGRWAVVTGAGSGIGRAIADRLAALGCNVVAAGRTETDVKGVAEELAARYGVEAIPYGGDLRRPEAAGSLHAFCLSRGIETEILVNNAGTFLFNDLLVTPDEKVDGIIALHVITFTRLCRLFGNDMAARGHGYILNTASLSAWLHFPGIALYSATKAYVHNISVCLSYELAGHGVTVTTVSPAGVATDLYGLTPRFQRLGCRLGVLLTAEKTARKAVRAMLRGRKHTVPGWYNRLLVPLLYAIPGRAVLFLRRKTLRFQK